MILTWTLSQSSEEMKQKPSDYLIEFYFYLFIAIKCNTGTIFVFVIVTESMKLLHNQLQTFSVQIGKSVDEIIAINPQCLWHIWPWVSYGIGEVETEIQKRKYFVKNCVHSHVFELSDEHDSWNIYYGREIYDQNKTLNKNQHSESREMNLTNESNY